MTSVMQTIFLLAAVGTLTGCTIERRTDRDTAPVESNRRQVIELPGVPRLPAFSSAVRSGDLVFLSGQIGALPGVDPPLLVEGGIGPETRQAMENVVSVLGAAGASLEDLIKCTVFLADIADYEAMNEVYREYFPSDPPARSAMAGSALAFGARVEIECIAAMPES